MNTLFLAPYHERSTDIFRTIIRTNPVRFSDDVAAESGLKPFDGIAEIQQLSEKFGSKEEKLDEINQLLKKEIIIESEGKETRKSLLSS